MASNNQPPRQSSGGEEAVMMGVILLGTYLIIWATWYFGHKYIATAYGYVRYVELYLFHLLGELVSIPGISHVHGWIANMCAPDGLVGLCTRDFNSVVWDEIVSSTIWFNGIVLVGVVFMCVKMFMRVDRTHPKVLFARKHNLKTFVDEMKRAKNPKDGKLLYPHLRMFSAIDLISQPLDHPVFGMSETSKQFAYKHRLIQDWRREDNGDLEPSVDRRAATLIFREQLGMHWTESRQLNVTETLLVAIAIPRVVATDANLSDDLFKTAMNDSDMMTRYCWDQFKPPVNKKPKKGVVVSEAEKNAWLTPEISLEFPREIIKKYIGHPNVKLLLEKHAFKRTVIFAMFIHARRLGILPPSEMRWLRFFDRGMWYALQSFGRQSPFPEASGLLCHYLYEVKSGEALIEPQLDKAVTALENQLNKFKFTDVDRTRYESMSK